MKARMRILVTGTVQGVGFRPAVARAASALGFSGWVTNTRQGAEIQVQGEEDAIRDFVRGLAGYLPPNARLETLDAAETAPLEEGGFEIRESSREGLSRFSVPPDLATCPACRREFSDPGDRRYRHPFISCGDCGPRYTYILDLPYDRALTTMADFPMCPACLAEYEDPRDRRYHIEGFCCPDCGPVLRGLEEALKILRAGGIVAVKGIGGYHLACLAEDPAAVAELRRRKARPTKPLAVMYPGIEELEEAAALLPGERGLLLSPEAPIVLVPKSRFRRRPLESLAPDNPALGVFIPYAPVQLLLLGELGAPLVMTSANLPGDPLVIDDEVARTGLAAIVDGYVWHERRIRSRADDGVALFQGPGTTRIRNGRGSVPSPLRLARPCPRGVLAVGAELKSTVTVASGRDLVSSPHIGDLENEPTFESFRRAAEEMLDYYGVEPELVVADLHPDYESTRYAQELSEARSIPLLQVQHHHAHLLSALLDLGELGGARGGLRGAIGGASGGASGGGPWLGIVLDGTGYGEDGTIWGGELLLASGLACERLAHLSPLRLPGGEAAIREPWRILAAYGLAAARRGVSGDELAAVAQVAASPRLSPESSSCGRLFDAAAALLGFERRVTFEGEAAVWLESLAAEAEAAGLEAAELEFPALDGLALLAALAQRAPAARDRGGLSRLALCFHASLARNIASEAARLAKERGLVEAFLSGGVFQNRLFTRELVSALAARGLAGRMGARVPPNDACISVGQAAYAIEAASSIL